MAVTAHDVQIFVWKMIKLSSKTCFNVSIKHPYITSCSLFLFILYMYCPLFFWILIYSLPFAVCAWVARKISSIRNARECQREKEKEKERDDGSKKTKFTPPDAEDRFRDRRRKSYSRVHSVRRRKAKEIATEEARSNAFSNGNLAAEEDEEDERNAISSPTDSIVDTVEKGALVDESPKEIREVEVDNLTNLEFYQDPDLMKSLKLLREDEDTRDEANKAMDVGISDAEQTKRLESLIARRKSRKVLNLQVRRSLTNTDAPPIAQIAPMVIPKINTWCSPSKPGGGPFSPVPGSAPSIMIPMRNPFDLPYDPQEEKPDLTGDSFQQEFASGHNRDMMFCRHESFSLGPSLPLGFFDDRDDLSSVDDFGFRRRRPIVGYQFSKPENEESDTDFGLTTDAESGQEHESESNIDSPDDDDDDDNDDDQIKEVIQVHENVTENHRGGGATTKPNAQDELSLSSSSSSIGSSEDERPVRIINREAILKSLSMRRNSVDIDTNENLQENNLTYANSALENASRLKQEYFAHKPQKRHGMTFSIASDMQVEVSEISSPPLTIDENMSYRDDASTFDGEMDRNTSWDGLDSWAGSSRLSEVSDNDTRLSRANEAGSSRSRRPGTAPMSEKHSIHPSSSAGEFSDNGESQTTNSLPDHNLTLESNEVVENIMNVEPVQQVEGEGETSTNPAAIDSNDPRPPHPPPEERSLMQDGAGDRVHQTTISPKSVLQPTLSIASFEHDADDEAQLSGAHSVPQNPTPLVQFTVATSSSGDAQASQVGEINESFKGGLVSTSRERTLTLCVQQEASRPPSNASTSGAKDTESSASNGKQKILENIEKPNEEAGGSSSSQILGIQEPPSQTVDEKLKMQENSKDANPTNLSKNEMGNPTPHEHDTNKLEDLERQTNSTTSNDPDDKKDEIKDLKHAE